MVRKNQTREVITLEERAKLANYVIPPPKYHSASDPAFAERDYMGLLMDPERTALIVIDVTNMFTEPGAPIAAPEGTKIVPNINKLAQYCRKQEMPVIWVRTVNRPDGSDLGLTGKYGMPYASLSQHVTAEDNHWSQLYPELDFKTDDIYIKKLKYNAFWGTDLEAVLRGLKVESLIFTGIATDVCVGTTLIDAFHRDYNPILVSDAVASGLPYAKEILWQMELFWCRVLTTDEVMSELKALAPTLGRTKHAGF